MDTSIFFEPAGSVETTFPAHTIGEKINVYSQKGGFPDLDNIDIVIIGVNDDRKAIHNKGCADAPDHIRKKLYRLFRGDHPFRVADLGNIQKGATIQDTYFALSSVIGFLAKKKIVTIIIGGSQDLTYANYCAYRDIEQMVNIVAVDSAFDMGEMDSPVNSQTYLSKIILSQPNYLFNFSNIGFQTYFVEQKSIALMEKMFFDSYRLGDVKNDMEEVEPIVRNADMLSFDISAVRHSDAPGNKNASPNGFFGDEACRIARYAGLSDKLTSFGIYEVNPLVDINGQTSFLAAEMIWYFIQGYYSRKKDYPVGDKSAYTKYRVSIKDGKYEIVFYKSDKSGRWWMEVPYPSGKKSKYERHSMIPCSYNDYKTACSEEMPDRWWQAYQKLG